MPIGHRLKALRKTRHLTLREVEEAAERIAEVKTDRRFLISNGWLTRLERGESEPGIRKLFSLSVIYNVNLVSLLKLYDVDVSETDGLRLVVRGNSTQLLPPDIVDDPYPSNSIHESETDLLSGNTTRRIKLRLEAGEDFNGPSITYGFIGLKDLTMYPLIRPGTIVRIDVRQNRPGLVRWRVDYDRPIYFVELRGAYACGWCELQQKELTIIPYHSSSANVRHFAYPQEAEIVGRVISYDTLCVDIDPHA